MRLLGKFGKPACPYCRAESGPECADSSRTKRQQKRKEKQEWKKSIRDEDI